MLNQRIIKRLTVKTLLVFLSCPVLSPLLLASFTVMSGFMTFDELKFLLTDPVSSSITLGTIAAGIILAIVPIKVFNRKFNEEKPTWKQIKAFNYIIFACFIAGLPIEITAGVVNLELITNIKFPDNGTFTALWITAFYLMVSVPLVAIVNKELDRLVRDISKESATIFNIKFKINLVILSTFIGSSLLFSVVASVSSTAIFELGRSLPVGISTLFILVGLTAIIIIVITLRLIMSNIVDPLNNMVKSFETGSQGDFTVTVPAHSSDEISLVALMANALFSKLDGGFKTILNTINILTNNKQQLGGIVSGIASAVLQIRENLNQTNDEMTSHASSVAETTAAVEELARNIDSLNDSIGQQRSILQVSSNSLRELLAFNSQLTDLSKQGLEKSESLVNVSQEGNRRIQTMQDLVNTINEDSSHLVEANTMIASVASQTNLLAMNAAIEAAHAGEAGKGFAVVADEIRKLAETASEQSKSIGQNLNQVLGNIENVGEESRTVQSSFQQIDLHVTDVQKAVENMSSFTKTVVEFSDKLNDAISELETVSSNVIQGSSEMQTGNSEILKAVTLMRDISQKVDDAVKEIAAGVDSISQQSDLMLEQNSNTDQSLNNVVELINKYKLS